MADKAPTSYKDPYWSDLSSATEEKLGLPSGLLSNIVLRGERSNNDQVSEAKASTVFQIIPATRKRAIDKYGIDPYLSPENAAEVAGLLLKDSLDRNDGNEAMAVAEYHGGTDRANWGPKTRAYVNRVMTGQREMQRAPQQGQSTFQRTLEARQPAGGGDAIAQVYDAYKSGQLTPEEASEFEADVNSGVVMLPKGAVLAGQESRAPTQAPAAIELPPEVTDAYQTGKMSEQERAELESDLKAGIVKLSASPTTLPEFQNGQIVPEQPGVIERAPDPTLGQQVVGAGETALALGTGATGGSIGMIGGTLKGLAEQLLSGNFKQGDVNNLVEKAATEGAEALTYAPRTQAGQEQTQAVGEALAPLAAVAPMAAELGAIAQGARAAAPAARAAIGEVAAPIQRGARQITEAIRPASAEAQTGARSGGAAAVEAGALRQAKAEELPVPIKLTEGQKSREFGQQRFERETAKDPELGEPIRQRFEDQNLKLQQNFDAFIDATGAETSDLRSVGQSVDKALRSRAASDKNKIRTLYKEAEKTGEMESPVTLEGLVKHIDESGPEAEVANVLKAAKAKAIQLGVATEGPDGKLTPQPVSLKNAELFRRSINGATNAEPTNIRQASIMKGLVDEATDGAGGEAYRKARAARSRFAKDYENVGLVKNLIGQKRGSNDRAIALEDVVRRAVIEPSTSLDDVRQVRRLLQTEGPSGQQAWKELQGATLNYIKEEALKNVARDQQGNAIVSPAQLDRAIQKLDKNGKLDFVFGKKGAEMLRTVNDVAKDILVAPPGAVNTSNTASVLAGLMDIAISGTSGVPAPIMTSLRLATKSIKDAKTRARVRKALGVTKKESE
jgi:hypothetical protein